MTVIRIGAMVSRPLSLHAGEHHPVLRDETEAAVRARNPEVIYVDMNAFGAGPTGRDMPGYFMNDFGFAADLIRTLGLPNLKLQYDIYHRQILHGDVMRSLEQLLPLTGHVQTSSGPHRHEPGTGELDDARIFRHLDAIGYTGYVGCEYRPAGRTLDGLSWMTAV